MYVSVAGSGFVGLRVSFLGVLWNFKNGRGLFQFLDTLGLFERERSGSN